MSDKEYQTGYVGLIGRPNVGKSTLMNRQLGVKLSITADKPQTTRHTVLGVRHLDNAQIVYVDTPGLHRKTPRAMNRYLNRAADATLASVDVIVWVLEALRWGEDEDWILQRVANQGLPVILAVNKVDKVKPKEKLLPFLQQISEKLPNAEIIPISARRATNLPELEQAIIVHLPKSPALFDEDTLTDRPMRFIAAEIIREKLTRDLHKELPYALSVEVEHWEESDTLAKIHAIVWVERAGQKSIVIGQGGEMLKRVSEASRRDLEKWLEKKVFLRVWVKEKSHWSDDERALQQLGYEVPK